jgi:hypothetical protein
MKQLLVLYFVFCYCLATKQQLDKVLSLPLTRVPEIRSESSVFAVTSISSSEVNALYDFYQSLHGEYWLWRLPESKFGAIWNFTTYPNTNINPCNDNWQGITCTNVTSSSSPSVVTQSISSMILSQYNLTGTIPSSISSLTSLEVFIADYNEIRGSLPPSFCDCSSLAHLELTQNHLSGNLSSCFFTNLPSLQAFSLIENQLTGSFPSFSLSTTTSLRYLFLMDNLIIGTLPASISLLTQLQYLYLGYNHFSGSVDVLLPLTKLQRLSLNNNAFSSTIPSSLGDALSSLSYLYIHANSFHGSLPLSLGNLDRIVYFATSFNYLTGSLPSTFSNFQKIEFFIISNNYFQSIFPSFLNDWGSSLQELSFYSNFFVGSLPVNAFNNLHNLTLLLFHNNYFHSNLDHNQLNTTELSKLQTLHFSENFFSNNLPTQLFSSHSTLQVITAFKQCFSIPVSSEICALTHLQVLDLDGMSANCASPVWPGVEGSPLYADPINGGIPSCLWTLSNLTTLRFSGNGLTGSIPSLPSYGNLSQLDLSYNQMTGSIPSTLQSWTLLTLLNLENNKFIGNINEMSSLRFSYAYSSSASSSTSSNGVELITDAAAGRSSHSSFSGLSSSSLTSATTRALSSASSVYTEGITLTLTQNRLSGDIPSSLLDAYNVNILEGNLFSCSAASSASSSTANSLPQHDPNHENYICGSNLLDYSLYLFAFESFLFILLLLIICLFLKFLQSFSNNLVYLKALLGTSRRTTTTITTTDVTSQDQNKDIEENEDEEKDIEGSDLAEKEKEKKKFSTKAIPLLNTLLFLTNPIIALKRKSKFSEEEQAIEDELKGLEKKEKASFLSQIYSFFLFLQKINDHNEMKRIFHRYRELKSFNESLLEQQHQQQQSSGGKQQHRMIRQVLTSENSKEAASKDRSDSDVSALSSSAASSTSTASSSTFSSLSYSSFYAKLLRTKKRLLLLTLKILMWRSKVPSILIAYEKNAAILKAAAAAAAATAAVASGSTSPTTVTAVTATVIANPKMKEIKYLYQFFLSLKTLRQLSILLMLLVVLLTTPGYFILKQYYGTYSNQYRWLISGVFFTGYQPSLFIIVIWFLSLWLVLYRISRNIPKYDRNDGNRKEKIDDESGDEDGVVEGDEEEKEKEDPVDKNEGSRIRNKKKETTDYNDGDNDGDEKKKSEDDNDNQSDIESQQSSSSKKRTTVSSSSSSSSEKHRSPSLLPSMISSVSPIKAVSQHISFAFHYIRRFPLWISFLSLLLNAAIVVTMKTAFLFLLLSSNTSYLQKIFLEFTLSTIDVIWGSFILPYFISNLPKLTSTTKMVLKTSMLFFNNIIVPIVIIMIADSSCFNGLFISSQAVSEDYSFTSCLIAPQFLFNATSSSSSLVNDTSVTSSASSVSASASGASAASLLTSFLTIVAPFTSFVTKKTASSSSSSSSLFSSSLTSASTSSVAASSSSLVATPSCLLTIDYSSTVSFIPFFNYNYNCYSTVLTSYIPIFLISYLVLIIAIPFMTFFILSRHSSWKIMKLFPKLFFIENDNERELRYDQYATIAQQAMSAASSSTSLSVKNGDSDSMNIHSSSPASPASASNGQRSDVLQQLLFAQLYPSRQMKPISVSFWNKNREISEDIHVSDNGNGNGKSNDSRNNSRNLSKDGSISLEDGLAEKRRQYEGEKRLKSNDNAENSSGMCDDEREGSDIDVDDRSSSLISMDSLRPSYGHQSIIIRTELQQDDSSASYTGPSSRNNPFSSAFLSSFSFKFFKKTVFFPEFILASAVHHLLVMITFGLMSPSLMIIGAALTTVTTLLWETLLGRWMMRDETYLGDEMDEKFAGEL